ncbi:MAG: hypothetical protein QOH39_3576 [Verrucomicrobiota bacterium]|jgi:hypothetical protein
MTDHATSRPTYFYHALEITALALLNVDNGVPAKC